MRHADATYVNLGTTSGSPATEQASLRLMPDVGQSPRSSPRSEKPATWRRGAVRRVQNTKRTTPEEGCMNPTKMAEKQRFLARTAKEHPDHRFANLYDLLHWDDWMHISAERVLARPGSQTDGVDNVTRAAFKKDYESQRTALIDQLKRRTYEPQPVRRVYIPKRDGKRRPAGASPPYGTASCRKHFGPFSTRFTSRISTDTRTASAKVGAPWTRSGTSCPCSTPAPSTTT